MTNDGKFIISIFAIGAVVLCIAMYIRIYEAKYNYESYKELYELNSNTVNELQVTNEVLRDSLLNIHIDYQRCLNSHARRQTR